MEKLTCKRCTKEKPADEFYFHKQHQCPRQPCIQCHSDIQKAKPKKGRNKPWPDRFWKFVDRSGVDGCWTWIGGTSPHGYGRIHMASGVGIAHRVSWELHYGSIPADMYVLHRCDNPPCVRPDHLFLGTAKDNAIDRESKGRGNQPVNEQNGKCKISAEAVRKIRSLRGKHTLRDLADMFGISYAGVCGIIYGTRRTKC